MPNIHRSRNCFKRGKKNENEFVGDTSPKMSDNGTRNDTSCKVNTSYVRSIVKRREQASECA